MTALGNLDLLDGWEIPRVGLGVWQTPDGPDCERAVAAALEAGYRLIDTAQDYGNELSVGRAIRASGIPREEIFVTTKFRPDGRQPFTAAQESVERLGLDYLDLYLVHWPEGGPTWAWPELEQAAKAGLTRSIGVSNFSADEMAELAKVAEIPAVLNQVYFSPFVHRRGLAEFCENAGVVLQAYSPLGTGDHLTDPVVQRIAAETGHTPAQVLIRWAYDRGVSVIPKSANPARITENFAIADVHLDTAALEALDALDTSGGTSAAMYPNGKWWS
ncbi:aldo/keto reductase [Kribbella sandramycini]|uniref:Aldo/keto reductase n=1 Tax=Kribbella sandramycini TaxID=60450 RepID=A0A7Y4NYB6_9ACTN|nr:aldo/keto reductase [Kribbella sandramycini]MBB6569834.1 diketogulonate reductase-like aldo/keto reductase [Kribbella sandramycini]NOL40341.1 aldo/keto reductase [Kribbella sandramycini]